MQIILALVVLLFSIAIIFYALPIMLYVAPLVVLGVVISLFVDSGHHKTRPVGH